MHSAVGVTQGKTASEMRSVRPVLVTDKLSLVGSVNCEASMKNSPSTLSSFTQVKKEEIKRIKERRRHAEVNEGDPEKDAVGLALSGGGVRSATFNLGILQALQRCGLLQKIDYLSTASGGGYIGTSLTWFMSRLGTAFPFGTSRADHAGFACKVVSRLRLHGRYLTPGDGLTWWALAAAVLAGVMVNLAVILPAFFLVILILQQVVPPWAALSVPIERVMVAMNLKEPILFAYLLLFGMALIFLFVVISFLYSLTTRIPWMFRYTIQRVANKIAGRLLMFGVLFVLIGMLPVVYDFIQIHSRDWIKTAISSISLVGVASALSALIGRKAGNEAQGIRSFLLSVGLGLASYGVFLGLYHLTLTGPKSVFTLSASFLAFLCSWVIAVAADINHVSMHRFYRNRLLETYMPYKLSRSQPLVDEGKNREKISSQDSDLCMVCDIPQTAAPYPIINTNVQTPGSRNPKLRERGGDSFIFTPLYSGSEATGYIPSKDYQAKMTLATAMAISGAAVDPNTYATRSRPLSFLMTLLNIRLGYWICNPAHNNSTRGFLLRHPAWHAIFIEMLGSGLHEKRRNIHLSDGGHFENLGLYELIKRRCRYIIVCDATADPNYQFSDLGKVVEKVRVDFGAKIGLAVTQLIPAERSNKISPTACVTGTITYDDDETADLIYLCTTLIDKLPEDIYAYQRKNSTFPDQGTENQFFDEHQFEAYRELGFQIGMRYLPHSILADSKVL